MIEFDYEIIQGFFDIVWKKTDFRAIVAGLKILAIAFLIIRYIQIFAKNTLDQRKISFGGKSVDLPINVYNLLYYFMMAALIAGYDHLLFGLDWVLGYFISLVSGLDTHTISLNLEEIGNTIPQDASPLEALKLAALEFMKMVTNPALFILAGLRVIVWLADLIIYGLFIGERFFILLILKLTGPIAICLSLLPGMEKVFGNWLALYARWFLVIIPYLLVNLVINAFLQGYGVMFEEFGSNSSLVMSNIKNLLEIPLYLFLAVLKFVLYSAAKNLYNEMIEFNWTGKNDG